MEIFIFDGQGGRQEADSPVNAHELVMAEPIIQFSATYIPPPEEQDEGNVGTNPDEKLQTS